VAAFEATGCQREPNNRGVTARTSVLSMGLKRKGLVMPRNPEDLTPAEKKAEAEAEKLRAEAAEIRKRTRQSAITGLLVKYVIPAVIGGVAVFVWVKVNFLPLMRTEVDVEKLENRQTKAELTLQIIEAEMAYHATVDSLVAENKALAATAKRLETKATSFDAAYADLAASYKKLAESPAIPPHERNQYSKLASESVQTRDSIRRDADQIRAARQKTEVRTAKLDSLSQVNRLQASPILDRALRDASGSPLRR